MDQRQHIITDNEEICNERSPLKQLPMQAVQQRQTKPKFCASGEIAAHASYAPKTTHYKLTMRRFAMKKNPSKNPLNSCPSETNKNEIYTYTEELII